MNKLEKLLSTILTAHSAVDERRKPMPTKDLRIVVLLLIALAMPRLAFTQLTPSQDASTNSAQPTTNFGAATTLGVANTTTSIQTTYIQFDLSSIPAGFTGANVGKATLKIYVNGVTTAGSFNVDFVNGTWSEKTITASNVPALGTAIASSVPLSTSSKNDYVLVDVTTALQDWLNGTQANDGIALVANSPLNATLDSKENTLQSQPAELDIVFNGAITAVNTAAGSGLAGGGSSGALSLSMLKSCSSSHVLQWTGSSWACSNAGTGTITGVTAGTDLTGGGTSGNVTLNVDTTKVAQLNSTNTFTANQTINGNLSGQLASFTGNNAGNILIAQNQNASGGTGIVGSSIGTSGIGMQGNASGSGGTGVQGTSSAASGVGVGGSGATGVTGTGAFASSVGVSGVGGSGSSSFGVTGTSGGVGVSGTGNLTAGSGGIGVTGLGASIGVSGSSGTNGTGVQGKGGDLGVFGKGSGTGVQGIGTNAGSFGVSATGVFGGVIATASQTSGLSEGVFGQSASSGGMGGLFLGIAASNIGSHIQGCCPVGVWGDTKSSLGGAAGLVGTADDARAIYLENNSPSGVPTAFMQQDAAGKFALVAGGTVDKCTIDTTGRLFCPGGTSAVAPVGARQIALYAVQSPQSWFEDFGSAQLSNGSATVTLDETFAQTVSASADYHVFLTPAGDCRGLYVSHKTATGFEVRELGGGQANVRFDYRIVALRRGFESVRMEDVTERWKNVGSLMPKASGPRPAMPHRPPVHNTSAKPSPSASARISRWTR